MSGPSSVLSSPSRHQFGRILGLIILLSLVRVTHIHGMIQPSGSQFEGQASRVQPRKWNPRSFCVLADAAWRVYPRRDCDSEPGPWVSALIPRCDNAPGIIAQEVSNS
eukprot:2170052-Rhodomonas_salina.1